MMKRDRGLSFLAKCINYQHPQLTTDAIKLLAAVSIVPPNG